MQIPPLPKRATGVPTALACLAALLCACVARPEDRPPPAATTEAPPPTETEGDQEVEPETGTVELRGNAVLAETGVTPADGAEAAFAQWFGADGPLAAMVDEAKACDIAPSSLLPTKAACPAPGVSGPDVMIITDKVLAAPAWTHGSTVALRGAQLLVLDRDLGTLTAIDAKTHKPLETLAIGEDPRQLVVAPSGDVWVALGRGQALVEVAKPEPDAIFGAKTVHPLGDQAPALAMSHSGDRVFVVLSGTGRLRAFHASGGAPLGEVDVGPMPVGVTTRPNGTVVVALRDAGLREFTLDDPKPGLQAGLSRPYQTVSEATPRAAADVVAASSPEAVYALHTLVVPGDPVNATSVLRVSGTVSAKLLSQPDEPKTPSAPVAPPPASPPYYGSATPPPTLIGPITPRLTRVLCGKPFSSEGGGLSSSWGVSPVAGRQRPIALALHPTQGLLAVVYQAAEVVDVVHLQSGTVLLRLPTSPGVTGVAFSADGKTLYANASHAQRVAAYDVTLDLDGMQYVAYVQASVQRCALWEVSYGESPWTLEQRAGRRLFHQSGNTAMTGNGDLACVSCHPGGGDDGVAWLGSQGVRQTPSLAGRLEGTAPFNWAGGAPSLVSNMQLTVMRLQGDGLCKEELAWLEAWMMAMKAPLRPNAGQALTPLQTKGKALFAQLGCGGCHVGGTGVDGQRHDVGTASKSDLAVAYELGALLSGAVPASSFVGAFPLVQARDALGVLIAKDLLRLDTPSLAGLWHTAPYLHDGSAATLEEVLQRTKGTMGDTAGLSDAEAAALVAFLKTL